MNVKLIRAFIASPGGLENERAAARVAANEVDLSVARLLGCRLEIIGWEETLSGIGRPQALINADMESCDLFIGVIGTNWGSSPSSGGPYTSGFEEEFETSRERNARYGRPDMAMFFKEVPPLQLRDPGESLRKVLEFRDRLFSEKSFLCGRFEDASQFERLVRDFLTQKVIRIMRNQSDTETIRPGESKASRYFPAEEDSFGGGINAVEASFLLTLSRKFAGEGGLTPTEIARLRLVGVSAATSWNDEQILGVHDANLLYVSRHDIEYSFDEQLHLLECGLARLTDENVPVWSWLAELAHSHPTLLQRLTVLPGQARRVGALTAMRLLGMRLELFDHPQGERVQTAWFQQGTPSVVKVAALEYLQSWGTISELGPVKREVDLADKETVSAAMHAAIAILLREDGLEAARYLIKASFEELDRKLLNATCAHFDRLDGTELSFALTHRSPHVRANAFNVLSRRVRLDQHTIHVALNDDAPMVRIAALRALDGLGFPQSLDEASDTLIRPKKTYAGLYGLVDYADSQATKLFESYRMERFRRMSPQGLKELLKEPRHQDAAYLALAEAKVEDFASKLRADIKDSFDAYILKNRQVQPIPERAPSLLGFGVVDTNVQGKISLIRAALDVIASERCKDDLALVRHVLDVNRIAPSRSVIGYFETNGSRDDIERLGRAPLHPVHQDDLHRDNREYTEYLARAILKIAENRLPEILMLPCYSDVIVKSIGCISPVEFAKLDDVTILRLLLSEEASIRRAIALKVPGSLPRKRVQDLLAAYRADQRGVYYEVTHWLDLGLAYSGSTARAVASLKR